MNNPPLFILRGVSSGLANDEQRNLYRGEISRNIESQSTEDAHFGGRGSGIFKESYFPLGVYGGWRIQRLCL